MRHVKLVPSPDETGSVCGTNDDYVEWSDEIDCGESDGCIFIDL